MSHKTTQNHTKRNILFKEECYKIIECAFIPMYRENELGYGFLEKVYTVKYNTNKVYWIFI